MIEFRPRGSVPQGPRDGNLNAVVLVGGGSRRMGRPKQKLRLGGVTLVEIAIAAVGGLVDRVVVAGGGELPESLDGLERLADAPGVQGPLGGILAAMRWAPESAWLVAACDMPRIRHDAVAWILSQREPEVWAVLPKPFDGRVEPLLAVYEPQLTTVLERRAASGRFGLQDLAGSARVVCPRPPENLRDAWLNVNTLEDFESSVVIDV